MNEVKEMNALYFGNNRCELNTTLKTGKEEDLAREIEGCDEVLAKLVVTRERRRRSEMKRLLLLNIIWILLISTEVFGQSWSAVLLKNVPIDGPEASVTSPAVGIGSIDPRTLTVWTNADEDDGNVDVKIQYQFKLKDPDGYPPGYYDWDLFEDVIKDHMKKGEGWTFWRFIEPTKTKADEPVDPNPGQNFEIELGEDARNVELICLNFTLETDGTDVNRNVLVIIEDPAESLFARLQFTTPQGANQTRKYSFFPGTSEIGPSDIGICQAPMPPNLLLKGGAIIKSVVDGIRPSDQISDISLGGRKGVQPEFDFKMPGAADSLRFIVSGNAENGPDIDIYLSVSGYQW